MKSGDRVTITDDSWTRSIIDGKLVAEFLACDEAKGRRYTVIEVGCSFPLVDQKDGWGGQRADYRNDTVIQDDDDKVVLIHSGFLKLVDPPHVWEHGDVFERGSGVVLIYIELYGGPHVYDLRAADHWDKSFHPYDAGDLLTCLADATFLFNIKSKL